VRFENNAEHSVVTAAPAALAATAPALRDLLLPQPTSLSLWPNANMPEQPNDGAPRPAYNYDSRLREYDAFFGIVRSDEQTMDVFADAVHTTFDGLVREVEFAGTDLDQLDWHVLCSAFEAMVERCAARSPAPQPAARPPAPTGRMGPSHRWQVGHRVFFVLTQGLIVALRSFAAALSTQDIEAARAGLRLAALLLDASAAAFKFTGEFNARQYERSVRPSMEPPAVSEGFSGLLSPDHQYLVRVTAALRPVLAGLPDTALAADHQALVSALRGVYATHKYVCSRFAGDTEPSLRTAQGSGKAAVQVLDSLGQARVKCLTGK